MNLAETIDLTCERGEKRRVIDPTEGVIDLTGGPEKRRRTFSVDDARGYKSFEEAKEEAIRRSLAENTEQNISARPPRVSEAVGRSPNRSWCVQCVHCGIPFIVDESDLNCMISRCGQSDPAKLHDNEEETDTWLAGLDAEGKKPGPGCYKPIGLKLDEETGDLTMEALNWDDTPIL